MDDEEVDSETEALLYSQIYHAPLDFDVISEKKAIVEKIENEEPNCFNDNFLSSASSVFEKLIENNIPSVIQLSSDDEDHSLHESVASFSNSSSYSSDVGYLPTYTFYFICSYVELLFL